MKYSIYNSIIELTKKTKVIYNAMADNFVFISNQIQITQDPNSLPYKIYETFKQVGIIVPKEKNEFEAYLCKAKEIECDDNWFHLIVNPTINCNFKCWYCYEEHYPSQMLPKTISAVNKFVANTINKHNNFRLSFFGGEPLLYYKQVISPIIKNTRDLSYCNKTKLYVDITSNGYLLSDSIISELKFLPELRFQITLDGGPKVHNCTRFVNKKIGSYKKIIENVTKLVQNGIKVTLRINCTKSNINSVTEIPLSFTNLTKSEKDLIQVDLQKVWQETDDIENEIDQVIAIFKDAGFKISHKLLGPFCYGDLKNSAMINYNGDVYKCTAVNFARNERDGHLCDNGQIIWENDSQNHRLTKKFTNKPCHTCKIFPLCHGGCSKHSIQADGKDYCLFDFNESKKIKLVTDRLLFKIRYTSNFNKKIIPNKI